MYAYSVLLVSLFFNAYCMILNENITNEEVEIHPYSNQTIVFNKGHEFDCKQASWGPWRCPGKENVCNPLKQAFRYKCPEGDCVDGSMCTNLPNYEESKPCDDVNINECKPWFGPWSEWSSCSATCGLRQKQRFRDCLGIKTPESVKNTCADFEYIIQLSNGNGLVQTDSCFFRRECPPINGGWSQWGPFTACSVTCGIGKRVRNRRCNNPIPEGYGLNCMGISEIEEQCQTKISCPQNGQWCAWNEVESCDQYCGGGRGRRFRRCECPPPRHGGSDCSQDNSEIVNCNTRPCPYDLDLSSMETKIWIKELATFNQETMWQDSAGKVVSLGDSIKLHCPKTINSRRTIFDKPNRFPLKRVFWQFRGYSLNASKNNILYDNESLTIRKIQKNNIGIYSLVYERDPGLLNIICFFPLIVSNLVQEEIEGNNAILDCNSEPLAELTRLGELGTWISSWTFEPNSESQKLGALPLSNLWTFDGNAMSFSLTSSKKVNSLTKYMSGLYQCKVINTPQNQTQRIFITQSIRIIVRPGPNIFYKVYEWIVKHIIYLSLLTGGSFICAWFARTYLSYTTKVLLMEYDDTDSHQSLYSNPSSSK